MDRKQQLLAVLGAVVALSAAASHLTIRWLGIATVPELRGHFGTENRSAPALQTGSSLAAYGISWDAVAQALGQPIESRGAPSASPCELEVLQREVPQANLLIIGVSAYDLNEHFIGDFRSEIVPFRQTIRDLWQSREGWAFARRVLSQYPLTYLRILFPTTGRSLGVMVGIRERLRKLLKRPASSESEEGPRLGAKALPRTLERISDWAPGRTLRNLAQLNSSCQGRQAFDGPKKLALDRMLQAACRKGKAVVLVLPVSPPYKAQFLTPDVVRRFEQALADAQRRAPATLWVRLDQLPQLDSNDYFWDLVHLNVPGQQIATQALIERLKPFLDGR